MKNEIRINLLIGCLLVIGNLGYGMGSKRGGEATKEIKPQESEAVQENTGADEVAQEEYVPEVIIEGKWGSGEGEFGYKKIVGEGNEIYRYMPNSLTEDSLGNIYILDMVNNRIQKFNNNGKYLESIKVDSYIGDIDGYEIVYEYKGNIDKSYVTEKGLERYKNEKDVIIKDVKEVYTPNKIKGINIVIDRQNNLYYYLIKPQENKGEVWRFKNDKLKEKWEVPYRNYMNNGISIDTLDNSVWLEGIYQNEKPKITKKYNVKQKRVYTKEEYDNRQEKIEREYRKEGINRNSFMKRGSSESEPINLKITKDGIEIRRIKIINKK